jgi:small subunit ribosomal protein S16
VSVKIRLKRIGSSKKPYYRIMVLDSRITGKGSRVEDLGTYNPKAKENQVVNFKKEAAAEWIKKGAIASVAVMGLLKKAGVKL